MKKMIAMLLAVLMLLSLAACGGEQKEDPEMVFTRGPEEETEAPVQQTEAAQPEIAQGKYTFTIDGLELIPGTAFDPTVLGEPAFTYEVPSCAIEGTDNVYNYETFEVTAYDDGTGEVIYSIYFLDPNLTTGEGLALGDSADKVTELYGDNYAQEGNSRIYSGELGLLYVIEQDGVVVSIEYRMIVE